MRALALVGTLVVALTATTAAATATEPLEYVALGDSAAAGPAILPLQAGAPPVCLRSARDLPSVLAAELGARLTDRTCSGATTAHLGTAQAGNPPQLDGLSPDTDLVTVGPLGGNDVQTTRAVLNCLLPGCADRLAGTFDSALATLRADLDRGLGAVRDRAPNAEIVVLGYGRYFPPGGCPGVQPLTPADADFVQGLVGEVNAALAAAAAGHGARFVDLGDTPGSAAHTTCAAPAERWAEGAIPLAGDGAVAFHPTALGMRAWGAHLASVLRSPPATGPS